MFNIFNRKFHPFMDADGGASSGGSATPPATDTETGTGSEGAGATGTGGDNGGATGAGSETGTGSTGVPGQSKQTPEQDAAFAELRRKAEKAEAAEKRANELERDHGIARKYGAEYGVYSEADIAEKFGQSHGIKTLADFEAAVQREEYKAKGIDPDAINQLIENHPVIKEAKQREVESKRQAEYSRLETGFSELSKAYPDLIKKAEDIDQGTWDIYLASNGKVSLQKAFEAANLDKVLPRTAEAARQKMLNSINGKAHLGTEGDGGTDTSDTHIDAETLQMYMDQGMSKADAQKYHKKLYG